MAPSWFDFSVAPDFLSTGTVLICLVVFLTVFKIPSQLNSRMPPGPIGLPVIGSLLTLVKSSVSGEHPHDMMKRLADKYGKIFCLGFGGGNRLVVLNDFVLVAEAFKNPDITDRPKTDLSKKTVGAEGVLGSSGEVWKHQRRFSLSVFRSFGVGKKSFEDRVLTEAECLSEEFDAFKGAPFDPKHYLMNATSNIICSIIFGERFSYTDKEFKRILSILDTRLNQAASAGALLVIVPLLSYVFSRAYKEILACMLESFAYFKVIVDKHKSRFENSDECNDFIDLFLKEIEKNNKDGDEHFDHVDEKHLLAIIDHLFLAGTETSSNTLGWCLLYMSTYPDVQRKIQDEMQSVCGERLPSYGDQQNMPYTDAVILEIQRLHTIVPLGVPHCANRDTTIQGYEVPKGTIIISNLWGVLHDPEVWSDPETFKPERFLNREGEIDIPKEWIPFSTGRRSCLGERLAKMEIFIFLTHLLSRFSFKKPDTKADSTFEGRSGATYSPLPFKILASSRYHNE